MLDENKPPLGRPVRGITHELAAVLLMVSEHGSIAAAARELNLDPSLATKKIAQLELIFEARLFERTTRTLKPTEAGVVAIRCAREVLDAFLQAKEDISALLKEPSGNIRLAVSQFFSMVILPDLLVRFRQRYPKVSFSITMTDTLVTIPETNFDLVIHSGRVPSTNMVGRRIKEYFRILCATPQYLAEHGTPVEPTDLARHKCLTHSASETLSWHFQHGNSLYVQPISPTIEVNSYSVLIELAKKGLGIVRVSDAFVREELQSGKLVQVLGDYRCVNADGDIPGLWVLYPHRNMPYRTRTFVNFLLEELTPESLSHLR